MNKYPNLPSISTLLTLPPSPPRIIIEDAHHQQQQQEEEDEQDHLSQRYLKSPNNSYNRLSPMLSPIDSYASSVNSACSPTPQSPLPSMLSLPPLQGDDPPRRLQRHSSISSSLSSPKQSFNSLWTSSAPPSPNPQHTLHSPSLYPTSPSMYPTSPSLYPQLNSPSLYAQQDTFSPLPQPIPKPQFFHKQPTQPTPSPPPAPTSPMMLSSRSASPVASAPPLLPSTQIVLNESGQPVLKRRRGRPPSMREPALEGGWTFLTPTVWDVNNPQQQRPAASASTTTSQADSVMNGSMAAFTSSNMDMVLQMPRKKRGRKPKTHIVGNSCFVWKDITASRRSTKVIQEQKAALRKLEQAPE